MKFIWNQCDKFDDWFDGLPGSKMLLAFAIMLGIPLYGFAGIFFYDTIIPGGLLCILILVHCVLTSLLSFNKKRKKCRVKKE